MKTLFLILILTTAGFSQDLQTQIKQEQTQQKQITQLQRKLELYRRTRQTKKAAEVQKELDKLVGPSSRKPEPTFKSFTPQDNSEGKVWDIQVGSIGYINNNTYAEIKQILDGKTMTVRMFHIAWERSNIYHPGKLLIIEGLPTEGLTDEAGNRHQFNELFKVTGTRKLTTVLGSTQTLLVLSPVKENTLDK